MAVKSRWRCLEIHKDCAAYAKLTHHVSRVLPRALSLLPPHYQGEKQSQGTSEGTTDQITSPFLAGSDSITARGRKFWLSSVSADGKEVFSGIFDNIHLKKLNKKQALEEACSAQSVEGVEADVLVNAMACQKNEDCEKLISRPVLTGGSKLLCVPNMAAINKKIAADTQKAPTDATVRLRWEVTLCVYVGKESGGVRWWWWWAEGRLGVDTACSWGWC